MGYGRHLLAAKAPAPAPGATRAVTVGYGRHLLAAKAPAPAPGGEYTLPVPCCCSQGLSCCADEGKEVTGSSSSVDEVHSCCGRSGTVGFSFSCAILMGVV